MTSSAASSRRRQSAARKKSSSPKAYGAKTNQREGVPPGPGAWFDTKAADRACEFFRDFMKFTKGELGGKPFALAPWQRDLIVRPLFGWMRKDKTRWYRRCDLWVPRKNGKSTLVAGVVNYLLFGDDEVGAEVYLVANDKEQASIVFRDAAEMVKNDDHLSVMSEIFDSDRTKLIWVPSTSSSLQAVSAEPRNKDGLNPSGVVFDEIHELRKRALWAKMRTGSGARKQPVLMVISTAGEDRTSIGFQQYEADKRIVARKSQIKDRLVVIFEADPSDDWKNRATWRKANPQFDVMPSLRQELESRFAEALESADDEATFKRYCLNLWTASTSKPINMDKWDACGKRFDPAAIEGLPAWIGLDISKRSDITAAVRLHKQAATDQQPALYFVLPHFFVPEEDIELKESRDGVPYRNWAKAGYLTLTPGNVVDHIWIRDHILALARRLKDLREISYDPYHGSLLARELADAGLTTVEFPQFIKHVAAPTKLLMDSVLAGHLRHGGNPVLRWMADNAATIRDLNDNEKFTKKASTSRIDGITALVNGIGRASVGGGGPSVYESRGLVEI